MILTLADTRPIEEQYYKIVERYNLYQKNHKPQVKTLQF